MSGICSVSRVRGVFESVGTATGGAGVAGVAHGVQLVVGAEPQSQAFLVLLQPRTRPSRFRAVSETSRQRMASFAF